MHRSLSELLPTTLVRRQDIIWASGCGNCNAGNCNKTIIESTSVDSALVRNVRGQVRVNTWSPLRRGDMLLLGIVFHSLLYRKTSGINI